jgi:hypothetical protein
VFAPPALHGAAGFGGGAAAQADSQWPLDAEGLIKLMLGNGMAAQQPPAPAPSPPPPPPPPQVQGGAPLAGAAPLLAAFVNPSAPSSATTLSALHRTLLDLQVILDAPPGQADVRLRRGWQPHSSQAQLPVPSALLRAGAPQSWTTQPAQAAQQDQRGKQRARGPAAAPAAKKQPGAPPAPPAAPGPVPAATPANPPTMAALAALLACRRRPGGQGADPGAAPPAHLVRTVLQALTAARQPAGLPVQQLGGGHGGGTAAGTAAAPAASASPVPAGGARAATTAVTQAAGPQTATALREEAPQQRQLSGTADSAPAKASGS